VNTATRTTARTQAGAWLAANTGHLGWDHIATKVDETPAAILAASYRTTRYLIDITVWDHAFCLDILVLNATTGEQLYSVGGSCENADGVLARLREFETWFTGTSDAA
jgi:hypothetical protein